MSNDTQNKLPQYPTYDQETFEQFIYEYQNGPESFSRICQQLGLDTHKMWWTIGQDTRGTNDPHSNQSRFLKAKETRAHALSEETIDISEDTKINALHNKNRIQVRQSLAKAYNPTAYGNAGGDDDGQQVQIRVVIPQSSNKDKE